MKRSLNIIPVIFAFLTTFSAYGYDLPEVIGYINGGYVQFDFATDFCWVGDQNDDGYDDLMLSRDPFRGGANTVEIFYGGERIDDEPDIIFTTDREDEGFGFRIQYLGNIFNGHCPYLAIRTTIRIDIYHDDSKRILLYESAANFDNEPDIILRNPIVTRKCMSWGKYTRPTDLNGDGYNDVLLSQGIDHLNCKLNVYFGGEEIDTIPDWSYTFEDKNMPEWIYYSSGYDINGDGYHDLLMKYRDCKIFLGGEEMDTIPDIELDYEHFEDIWLNGGFSLLPDINGDGYDDWGLYYGYRHNWHHGYYIFFGGEEPGIDDFIEFEDIQGVGSANGQIVGGDFNNDGYGDIVTSSADGFYREGAMTITFGSRWMDGDPDIVVNMYRDYGDDYTGTGEVLGAAGDYNGDGVDDFCALDIQDDAVLVIFAGNEDWEVGVDEEISPDEYSLSLRSYPNPFNEKAVISYDIKHSGDVFLGVYDIEGRLIEIIENKFVVKGSHRMSWESHTAGIYFVVLDAGGERIVRKVVSLK